ncbi:MAG: spore germination protein [Firmicutes bacterium]|nr:spore germination protein [Bacillota bacterium]
MKQLNCRQTAIISVFLLIGMKLLVFPSLISEIALHDAVYTMLFTVAVEFAILLPVLFVLIKNPDRTFFEAVAGKLGKITAHIISLILVLFFLSKLVYILIETYAFLMNSMFYQLVLPIFILPIAFVSVYLAAKGGRTAGRTCEIFFGLVLAGLIITVISALPSVNLTNILPGFEFGITPSLSGVWQTMLWSGNSLLLLFFMGKIKIEKGFLRKAVIFNGLGGLFLVVFVLIFSAVFDTTAGFFKFAIVNLTQVTPYISDIVRLEWLALITWTFGLVLTAGIILTALNSVLVSAYKISKPIIPAAVLFVAAAAAAYVIDFNYAGITNLFLESKFAAIGVYAFSLLLIGILLVSKKGGRKSEINI